MKLALATRCLAASLALGLAFVALGDDEKAAPGKKPREETPLEHNMEQIEHGIKKLRRDLKDAANNAASLEIVLGMQDAVSKCKVMIPPLTEKKPEAERAAFVRDYRKTLIAVQKDMLDLELAILDGDQAKAQETLKRVNAAEDPGHEKFTEDD